MSSHLLNEVEQLIDQVVIISQGVTRYYGSLDQLRKGQQSRVLVQPADAAALVKALQENGIQQVSPTPDGRVAVAGSSVQQIGDLAAKAGIAVYGMQEEHADLERMFFQLTQGQYAGGPGFPPQQPQYQGPPPGYQGPPSGPQQQQQYQQGPPTGGQYQQGPPSGPQQQQLLGRSAAVMGNLIKAEFRKTLSLNTWWVLLIPLVLVAFWLTFVWGKITNDFADFIGSSDAREVAGAVGLDASKLPVGLLAFAHGVNIAQLVPALFGVFALAGEYRSKTITTTFLTAPNRISALTAKMLTYVAWGAIYGLVSFGVSAVAVMVSVDSGRWPSAGQWLAALGGTILASVLVTLFGIGFGAVLRSVPLAVVLLLVWFLIVENVLVIAHVGRHRRAGRHPAERHGERDRRRHRGGRVRDQHVEPAGRRRPLVAAGPAARRGRAGRVLVVGFGADLLRVDDAVLRPRLGGQPEARHHVVPAFREGRVERLN